MRPINLKKQLLLFVPTLLLLAGPACAQEIVQADLIQRLIGAVEDLPGAVFIRNGVEYDAAKAAEHLRLKFRMAGGRIKTADDFIRLCASKSSVSGEAYHIRLSNGTSMEAEKFFTEKLKEIQSEMKAGSR